MTRIATTALTGIDEPLRSPFGFKGGAVDALRHTVARITLDDDTHGLGVAVQSILYADPDLFHAVPVAQGNALMQATTAYALDRLTGRAYTEPPALIADLLPDVRAYAAHITGRPDITETFVLNALVAVDFALWQLWARRRPTDSFDDLAADYAPALTHRADTIANIPLITYTTPDAQIRALLASGTPIMKIKIGSDPRGDNDPEAMCAWDIERVNAIHALAADIPTPYTEIAHPLYYLDANGRYPTSALLARFLEGLRPTGALDRVCLLEEPYPADLGASVRDLPVRVAADEQVHTADDLRRLVTDQGYGAVALKPIAKTLSVTLDILAAAHTLGIPAFCADLTVPPVMVDWNLNVAARLAPLPGLRIVAMESNGAQNYTHWDRLRAMYPRRDPAALSTERGLFRLSPAFYGPADVFAEPPAYRALLGAPGP